MLLSKCSSVVTPKLVCFEVVCCSMVVELTACKFRLKVSVSGPKQQEVVIVPEACTDFGMLSGAPGALNWKLLVEPPSKTKVLVQKFISCRLI